MLVSKYGHHLPLHRQSAIYARESIEIDVSTLADWVGSSVAAAMPLVLAIQRHVFAAERIHADDTTAPVLAKEKTRIGRPRRASWPRVLRTWSRPLLRRLGPCP